MDTLKHSSSPPSSTPSVLCLIKPERMPADLVYDAIVYFDFSAQRSKSRNNPKRPRRLLPLALTARVYLCSVPSAKWVRVSIT